MLGRRHPTHLHRKRWRLSGTGIVRLVEPTLEQLAEIDDRWPTQRRETDWHHSWRWQVLTKGKPEVFAGHFSGNFTQEWVESSAGRGVGTWSATWYRLSLISRR